MTKQIVGARLQEARLNANISRKVAADYIGMSKSTIAMVEIGERELKLEKLHSLCSLYQVPVSSIVDIEDRKMPNLERPIPIFHNNEFQQNEDEWVIQEEALQYVNHDSTIAETAKELSDIFRAFKLPFQRTSKKKPAYFLKSALEHVIQMDRASKWDLKQNNPKYQEMDFQFSRSELGEAVASYGFILSPANIIQWKNYFSGDIGTYTSGSIFTALNKRILNKDDGFVYFLYCENDGLYKIGSTYRHPLTRLAEILNEDPYMKDKKVEILTYIYTKDCRRLETLFHSKFLSKKDPARKDWFSLSSWDLYWIMNRKFLGDCRFISAIKGILETAVDF